MHPPLHANSGILSVPNQYTNTNQDKSIKSVKEATLSRRNCTTHNTIEVKSTPLFSATLCNRVLSVSRASVKDEGVEVKADGADILPVTLRISLDMSFMMSVSCGVLVVVCSGGEYR